MIKFENVTKKFEGTVVAEHINLSINKGSIYGLLGSNGAGKTTLLKLLAGIYLQEAGKISINGQSVYENPVVKNSIFFIPDYPFFLSQYSIVQMGQFYRSIYSNWNEARFQHLLEAFNIDKKKRLHTYSKGLQRQSAFILALSSMPDILILDEPMDGLDPVVRKNIKSLIIEDVAEREMTVLISSHNLREVEDLCDTVGILHKGKLMIEKELDDLKSDTHKIQVAFRGDIPLGLFEDLQLLHQEKRGSILLCIVRGDRDELVRKINKYEPVIFDILPLTLEEIFIYEMEDVGYAIKNILS